VHLDDYAAQAWGRVDRREGKQWREVVSMRVDALSTVRCIGYRSDWSTRPYASKVKEFSADAGQLLKLAAEIL
jgi:hypothetical protein